MKWFKNIFANDYISILNLYLIFVISYIILKDGNLAIENLSGCGARHRVAFFILSVLIILFFFGRTENAKRSLKTENKIINILQYVSYYCMLMVGIHAWKNVQASTAGILMHIVPLGLFIFVNVVILVLMATSLIKNSDKSFKYVVVITGVAFFCIELFISLWAFFHKFRLKYEIAIFLFGIIYYYIFNYLCYIKNKQSL